MGFFNLSTETDGQLDLSAFINDDLELVVPAKYWYDIKHRHPKDTIKWEIVRLVHEYGLPVPGSFTKDGFDKAVTDFRRLLGVDTRNMILHGGGRVVTRRAYKWATDSGYYIQSGTVGNDASDYFHHHARMDVGTHKFKSPFDAWSDPDKLFYCLNALWSMKVPEINSTHLFNTLALRQYAASQFRVSAAKAIYELFGGQHILDTSSGWGDRMCGFYAAANTISYQGMDPNSRLHAGYVRQQQCYSSIIGDHKYANVLCSPSEDVEPAWKDGSIDVAFTSPPYFETERYSDEDTQSWKRYGNLERWLSGYLKPTLEMAWASLREGGILAMNIADLGVSYQHTGVCDPMNDLIESLPGAFYSGMIGLRLSIRPHTSIEKKTDEGSPVFVEPVWVWCKGESLTLRDIVESFRRRS